MLLGAAALVAALLPVVPSRAAAGPTMQVTREVNVVKGGEAVVLTARLSAAPGADTPISFDVETGPAKTAGTVVEKQCTVAAAEKTCSVTVTSQEQGSSLVRAWIGDAGASHDTTEARVANPKPTSLPVLGD